MKKIIIAITLTAALWSCAKPKAPAFTNPFDPTNPEYALPGVAIVLGPAEGSTLTGDSTYFAWQGSGSAASYEYNLDNAGWTATAATDRSFTKLYEGSRSFQVRALNERGQAGTPAARNFSVNVVAGPALMVYPKAFAGGVGVVGDFYCMIEEVTTPASAAHLVLNYNSAVVQLSGAADLSGVTLWTNHGGTAIGPYDLNDTLAGKIDISVGVGNGYASGSGRILHFRMRLKQAGTANITFDNAATIRDTLNADISLTGKVGSTVTVQ